MSRAVSARIRQEIAEADRYHCAYCLSPEVLLGVALTIDHILPVAAGGTNDRITPIYVWLAGGAMSSRAFF